MYYRVKGVYQSDIILASVCIQNNKNNKRCSNNKLVQTDSDNKVASTDIPVSPSLMFDTILLEPRSSTMRYTAQNRQNRTQCQLTLKFLLKKLKEVDKIKYRIMELKDAEDRTRALNYLPKHNLEINQVITILSTIEKEVKTFIAIYTLEKPSIVQL